MRERPQHGHVSCVFEESKKARVNGDEWARGRGDSGKVSISMGEIPQGSCGHWEDFGFLFSMGWDSLWATRGFGAEYVENTLQGK